MRRLSITTSSRTRSSFGQSWGEGQFTLISISHFYNHIIYSTAIFCTYMHTKIHTHLPRIVLAPVESQPQNHFCGTESGVVCHLIRMQTQPAEVIDCLTVKPKY
ncbi:UNVERIFIED_CONTAM: hypothetical protein K2H54_038262 [Gekko kuhli]